MGTIKRLLLVLAMGGLMEAVRSFGGAANERVQSAAVVLGVGFVLITSLFVGKLFSLARLSQGEPAQLLRRAQVETVHATGHLLALSHGADYRCAMFVSRDAADSDRKGPGLCASCRAALGLAPLAR